MRKTCLNKVHDLARRDHRVFFIGSDLGHGTLDEFAAEFPGRFLREGVSEANVVGMAAGLALEGKIVYVNTIATFLSRRAYEQIAVDLCMHNLPVRLIGNGGGLVYAPLGSTHLALEDMTLMSALPNMTVVCPCDAQEMSRFMDQTLDWPGPIYIRLGKGYDPVVSREEPGFAIGRGIRYREGRDALLVVTGVVLQEAVEAAALLEAEGVDLAILHLPTVKPLDTETLLDMAGPVRAVVVAEENTLQGGLGSAVARHIAEQAWNPPKKCRFLGIPDVFPDVYGSQKELMARFNLTAPPLAQTILELLKS